tara:strand:+ start:4717 stop:5637 length:921 start_codon:yes stop_codon:yes gene_type:complete
MKKILLAGCGQIGFRHVELLSNEKQIDKIYLYDKKIINCRKIINKLSKNLSKFEIIKDIKKVPKKRIFLCIVSTLSEKRFKLITQIYKYSNPKYMLVEKLVENDLNEIEKYYKYLKNKKIYVNCSNRMRQIFKKIKKKFYKKKINLIVSGGRWNMLSNSIHFFDFVSYVTNSELSNIKIKKIIKWVSSKHKNYKELFGEISAKYYDGSTVNLICKENNKKRYITIKNNKQSMIIDYSDNKIKQPENSTQFKTQYQSELTKNVFFNLLKKKKIELPLLRENIKQNIILLKELSNTKLFLGKKKIMIT